MRRSRLAIATLIAASTFGAPVRAGAGASPTAAQDVTLTSTDLNVATGLGLHDPLASDFFFRGVGGVIVLLHYGAPGDAPIMGDWNGDGFDTVGVKRGNAYYLRNTNTPGFADIVFSFGSAADTPVVGDWNGDGIDTVTVRRGKIWYVRNELTTGPADSHFSYGVATDTPLAGDWNGNGVATPGVYRSSTRYWYIASETGAVRAFVYGSLGDTPVVGDWNGDHRSTVGVRRGRFFYMRNSLSGGPADLVRSFVNPDYDKPKYISFIGHFEPSPFFYS
jgi:hypothetical protein